MLILVACKDPGGMNGVLPVVRILLQKHQVVIIAEGKAYEFLQNMGMECENYSNPGNVLCIHPNPNLFITSMDQGESVGRNLVPLLRGQCPIVALQDYWGAYLADDWNNKKYRPDYITVNDESGVNLVRSCWPEYPSDRIVITGFPAFDELSNFDVELKARTAREALGLEKSHWPIILFCGQADYTGHALGELASAINTIGQEVYLIARPHPNMAIRWPYEMESWKKAISLFGRGVLIEDSSHVEALALIAVSTVTVSMYSVMLYHAAALRKQVISILYPEAGAKTLLANFPGSIEEVSLIALGCTAKVETREELIDALTKAYTNSLGQEEAQKRAFNLDGRNAQRVVDFVSSLY